MKLECAECTEEAELSEMEFEVITEDEEIAEDSWYLDAEFEKSDGELPLEIKDFELYCPDHASM